MAWEKVSAEEHEHWAAGGPGSTWTVDMRRHVTGVGCGRDVNNVRRRAGLLSIVLEHLRLISLEQKGDRRQAGEGTKKKGV